PHFLVESHMKETHAPGIASGAQAQERDTVAMPRIHVRLDLEHEARERFFGGRHGTLARRPRERPRSVRSECCQQLFDAEVVDGRAEEHRGLPARLVGFGVETVRGTLHQLDLLGERARLCSQELARLIAREMLYRAVLTHPPALARLVDVDAILDEVINTAQL